MSYQFFKSSQLANIENLPEGVNPPSGGQWIKSNVENVNDGGIILRVMFNENNANKTILYISGSITSGPVVSQQIAQFISQVSSSSSPYVPATEGEFNEKLTEYSLFFSSL